MVGRHSWRSESGRELLTEVREWLGDPLGGSGCHPEGPGVVGRPSRRSGSGQETFSEGRNALTEVQEWSGGPP